MAERKWVKTVTELAKQLGIARQTLQKWKKVEGFPEPTKRGYNVLKCLNFILEKKAERQRQRNGEGEEYDLRARKLDLECQVLEARRDRYRGQFLTIEEFREEMSEYARIVNAVFDQWIQDVGAMTRNARLMRRAKGLRDRARKRLVEGIRRAAKKSREEEDEEGVQTVLGL